MPVAPGVPSRAGEPATEERGVVSIVVFRCAPNEGKPGWGGRAAVLLGLALLKDSALPLLCLPSAEEGRGARVWYSDSWADESGSLGCPS